MFVRYRLLTIDPGEIDVFDAPRHHVATFCVHISRSQAELNAPSASKRRPMSGDAVNGSVAASSTSSLDGLFFHLSRPATSLQAWGQTRSRRAGSFDAKFLRVVASGHRCSAA